MTAAGEAASGSATWSRRNRGKIGLSSMRMTALAFAVAPRSSAWPGPAPPPERSEREQPSRAQRVRKGPAGARRVREAKPRIRDLGPAHPRERLRRYHNETTPRHCRLHHHCDSLGLSARRLGQDPGARVRLASAAVDRRAAVQRRDHRVHQRGQKETDRLDSTPNGSSR